MQHAECAKRRGPRLGYYREDAAEDIIRAGTLKDAPALNVERGAGLTQAELADLSRVAQSTIAQIEGGARPNPHPRTLKKLAEALDLRARDLLPDE